MCFINAKKYLVTRMVLYVIINDILQTARIYSSSFIYVHGGRSAVGVCAENLTGVQYNSLC